MVRIDGRAAIGSKEAVMNRTRSTDRDMRQATRRQDPQQDRDGRVQHGELAAVAAGIIEVYPM